MLALVIAGLTAFASCPLDVSSHVKDVKTLRHYHGDRGLGEREREREGDEQGRGEADRQIDRGHDWEERRQRRSETSIPATPS